MSRPFNPFRFLILLLAMGLFAIVLPFAKRDDWIGSIAWVIICAFAVLAWGLLIFSWVCRFQEWRRDRSK